MNDDCNGNRDRTINKLKLIVKNGEGYLIDHEMTLEFEEAHLSLIKPLKWTIDTLTICSIDEDFDTPYFNTVLKIIQKPKLSRNYIHTHLLKDDTMLQFSDLLTASNTFPTNEKTVEESTKLSLHLSIQLYRWSG